MKRTRALMTTALPAALVAALALTGCSGGDEAVDQECAAPGDASKAVTIEGDFGGEIELSSEVPISVSGIERSVLIEGDGDVLEDGGTAVANFTLLSGVTGETIVPGAPTTVTNSPDMLAEWAGTTIACSAIGDRVVAVMPAAEIFGAGGGATYNLEDGDAIVAVLDFTEAVLARAAGAESDAPEDFPGVELDETGAPTITIPEGQAAPTELAFATVIEGDGRVVEETDAVTLHYTGAVWSNGQVFDSSWAKGTPISLGANQFVPGFTQAIVGQKVGSQVIALIPAADGYQDETATRLSAVNATEDDVMVFVIDILAALPATA